MRGIRAFIDARGNVHVDFVGYQGEECALDEEAFRRALADLGLAVTVVNLRRKDHQPIPPKIVADSSQRVKDREGD